MAKVSSRGTIRGTLNSAVEYVYPDLEDVNVVPSTEKQNFNHPNSYGYDKVTVQPVTKDIDSNIKPENIRTDVEILGVIGKYAGDTSDATATAEDITKGKTAYISGGKVTGAMRNIFKEDFETGYGKEIYKQITYLPKFDFGTKTTLYNFCQSMKELLEVAEWDTSNIKEFLYLFASCSKLKKVPKLNGGKATDVRYAFNGTSALEDFGGFEDLGKAYANNGANYTNYSLWLSQSPLLTHESLMNVINNLYDLNLTYKVASGGTLQTQKLGLGETLIAKLTADEIAIATNKGWTVS